MVTSPDHEDSPGIWHRDALDRTNRPKPPKDRLVFSDERVHAAVEFVSDTQLVRTLDKLITHRRGRPRMCTVEGLLVGMQLCAEERGAAVFNQVADILHWGIAEPWRRRFGLEERPDTMRGFEAGYRVVLRLFHRMLDVMDPSPLPKNKRLPIKEAEAILKGADIELLQGRKARLQWGDLRDYEPDNEAFCGLKDAVRVDTRADRRAVKRDVEPR